MLVEMLLDNPQILGVGTPDKVKCVAHYRNCANGCINADIGRHTDQLPLRHAQIAGLPHYVRPHCCGYKITQHGHEANDAV